MRPTTTAIWPASSRRVNRVLTWLKLPYECVVLYGALFLFGLSFFIWSAIAVVISPLLTRKVGARAGKVAIMWIFRGLLGVLKASGIFKFDLSALDALRDEGALIIAPNHPSLLDAVMVVSRLPHVACIMKSEIRDNLLLGGGARFAEYIRDDLPNAMVRAAVATLHDGNQLLMFPEGTRTKQNPLNDFRGGFALIAKTARVPVQTVFIETNTPFLGKGWPLYKMPGFPLIYRARLGQRFEVTGDVKTVVADLENYYRQTLAAGNAPRVDANA